MISILSVLYFLFSIVFAIMCYPLLIRIGLYYFKVSNLHPVSQLINTLTNPFVNLSKKLIDLEKKRPTLPYNILITYVIVVIIKYIIADVLFYGGLPILLLAIIICADLIIMPINLLFFAVLIRAIMSWINPHWHHPMNDVLVLFTEPMLKRTRVLLPSISGFDFSPLLILIFLQILNILISTSLPVRLL